MKDENNPFLSKQRDGSYCGAVSTDDRLGRVASFTTEQCYQALRVPALQKTVERAIKRRLIVLEKQASRGAA